MNRQTNKQTDIWTFRLIESIGPEGRCFENSGSDKSNSGAKKLFPDAELSLLNCCEMHFLVLINQSLGVENYCQALRRKCLYGVTNNHKIVCKYGTPHQENRL